MLYEIKDKTGAILCYVLEKPDDLTPAQIDSVRDLLGQDVHFVSDDQSNLPNFFQRGI